MRSGAQSRTELCYGAGGMGGRTTNNFLELISKIESISNLKTLSPSAREFFCAKM